MKRIKYLLQTNKFKILLILSVITLLIKNFFVIEGDPSIYLTFSKTFFESPFSFGQLDRISFGATSPVFLTIISFFHNLFGLDFFLIPFKFFYILIIFPLTIFFLSKLTFFQSNTFTNKFEKISIFLLLNFYLLENGIVLYESFLIAFYISIIFILYQSNKYNLFILFGGLAYLIRPELILINFISLYLVFKDKKLFLLLILSTLPSISYHLYMYSYTGEIIPTSVLSRSVRFSDQKIIMSYISIIRNDPYIVFQLFIIFFGALSFIKNSNNLIKISGIFGLIGVILFFSTKMFQARYFESFALLSMPITVYFLEKKILKKFNVLLFIFCCSILLFKIFNPAYSFESTLNNRLSRHFSNKINSIISEDDKILIYEIQNQYFLKSKVISLDSRVGSEAMELMKGNENLPQLMRTENIKYISIDKNISSLLKKDNYIRVLSDSSDSLEIGNRITINNSTFQKIFDKDDSTEKFKMYGDIFMIINE